LASIAKITEQGILEILEIARKHIINKGFAAVRMQEIADDAGINKAMLHYYFC
jgi:TetR/AcrR family transcriptional regulator